MTELGYHPESLAEQARDVIARRIHDDKWKAAVDYLSAPGECAKCDEARRIADVDMRRIEALHRKQISAELRAEADAWYAAANYIEQGGTQCTNS
jgi:hypothetical protein